MIQKMRIIAIFIICVTLCGCGHTWMQSQDSALDPSAAKSVVRVTVTSQGYHFHRPWQPRPTTTQTGIGAIVPGGHVLVTAMLVANHRNIELETIDTQKRHRAEVIVVDYEANLALLKPIDPAFLADRSPLEIAKPSLTGDDLAVWQVKSGNIIPSTGKITAIELLAYARGNYFLAYRMNNSLQYSAGNLTLPVLKGAKLAGLALRNNSGGQTTDVITTPMITHFLKDAKKEVYEGFPRAGFHYGPMLDPQLRRYIGLPQNMKGIYVQKVIKGGPADRAGLRAQDVIIRIGGFAVSNTGHYNDPQYGQTSLVHLIRTVYHAGDSVPFEIYRKGKTVSFDVKLNHRKPDEYLVPPYVIDQQPRYLIVGGLIFQELSVAYLREYGKDWASRAPIHLVYYQQNQDYLNGDEPREKIIIISNIIPTPFTVGYENLRDLVVTKVNNRPIHKLADVAAALKSPDKDFHKIEVEESPGILYLDPKEIPQIHQIIKKRYRIPIPSLDAVSMKR